MQFKIRCSAIGEIMGLKGLGKTGENYVQNWYKEQLYNRKKEFISKYTDKGIIVEDDSIDLIAEHQNLGMIFKNETKYSNDFFEGTPDITLKDVVLDVKNSWDCFSFPLLHTECPNMDYFWQLQGYMELTGVNKSKLIYTLMDAPESIIEQEARRESYRMGYSELDMEIYDQMVEKMTYSHLPMHLRIKVFEIDKCEASIQKIKDRVLICREYLKSIELNQNI